MKSLMRVVALTAICVAGLSKGVKAQSLQLFASPTTIKADGVSSSTLSIFEIACSTDSGRVNLSVSGPATAPTSVMVPLVQSSTTSATTCPYTPYFLYRGNAQATLTSTTIPGTVVVTASGVAVSPASVSVITTSVKIIREPRIPIVLPVQPPTNPAAQSPAKK